MFSSIRWRISIPYLALILLAMAVLSGYLSNLVRQTYLAGLENQLLAEALLLEDVLAPAVAGVDPRRGLDAEAGRYAELLGARVTIIGLDGTVLGESHEDRARMDNHSTRPEVQQALSSGRGVSVRRSATVGYQMMYVAVPLKLEDETAGVIRVALPLREIEAHISRFNRAILLATLLAALRSEERRVGKECEYRCRSRWGGYD